MNENFVSIIMPNFNGSRFIERAVTSVLMQKYKNWELLITDDNSSMIALISLRGMLHKVDGFIFLNNSHDKGPAGARNTSIERALYRAFLDNDDQWLENHLEERITHSLRMVMPLPMPRGC